MHLSTTLNAIPHVTHVSKLQHYNTGLQASSLNLVLDKHYTLKTLTKITKIMEGLLLTGTLVRKALFK